MVRFQSAIDNAVSTINNGMLQKVKNAQEETQRLLDKIMQYEQDMIDVLDTWNYIKEKNISKYLNEKLIYNDSHIKRIGVGKNGGFIGMRFNNWKDQGGGPYDWYVFFNREGVFIRINYDDKASVKDMISNAIYYKEGDKVVLPIFDKNHNYTCHDCSKPMNVLSFFSNRIEQFCTDFFNETQNITLE